MKRLFLLLAAVTLFAAATHTITINPGETVNLGDIDIVAPPLPPVEPCPECEACPECPDVPPIDPQPDPDPVPVPQPRGQMPLGVNLPGPDEWNFSARGKVLVDVMKSARMIAPNRWRVLTTSNNQEQSLNWSTSGSRQPKVAGTYLLSWDGGGTVAASGATVKNATANTADIVIASDSVDVDLQFTAPATNIALIRPGYTRGPPQTVTNEFKAFIAPFDTIRFMDAMVTNWADANDAAERFATLGPDKHMDWSERPADDAQTYHRAWGLSVEAVVRICNETGKNPWICIPWCATDDYLTGLAQYIKDNLNPGLVLYFEWGNELWNYAGGFYHSGLFRQEAHDYAVSGSTPKLANPPDNDYYYAGRYGIKRTIDASIAFEAALGHSGQFRPVISSQFANPSFVADGLNWALRSYPNPPSYYIAGIACAPYIGAGTGTPDQIIAALNADIATRQANDSKLMWWRGVADAYQVGLYMYEAGVDMGQGTANLTNRIAAAYDPRMQTVEQKYLESCYFDSGARNVMYFNGVCTRDKWGPAWGLTDDAADLQQPMYLGAKTFVATQAPNGGLTAVFYKKSDFTEPLGTIVIPVFNHRWQNWATGGIWGRPDVTTTEARNGSIRMTGRYLGTGALTVEKEANDGAVLTRNGDQIQIDYRAIFDGSGIAWGRLMADGKLVRQSELAAN